MEASQQAANAADQLHAQLSKLCPPRPTPLPHLERGVPAGHGRQAAPPLPQQLPLLKRHPLLLLQRGCQRGARPCGGLALRCQRGGRHGGLPPQPAQLALHRVHQKVLVSLGLLCSCHRALCGVGRPLGGRQLARRLLVVPLHRAQRARQPIQLALQRLGARGLRGHRRLVSRHLGPQRGQRGLGLGARAGGRRRLFADTLQAQLQARQVLLVPVKLHPHVLATLPRVLHVLGVARVCGGGVEFRTCGAEQGKPC